MATRPVVTDDQLQGFKYFKEFLPLLDRLHDDLKPGDIINGNWIRMVASRHDLAHV